MRESLRKEIDYTLLITEKQLNKIAIMHAYEKSIKDVLGDIAILKSCVDGIENLFKQADKEPNESEIFRIAIEEITANQRDKGKTTKFGIDIKKMQKKDKLEQLATRMVSIMGYNKAYTIIQINEDIDDDRYTIPTDLKKAEAMVKKLEPYFNAWGDTLKLMFDSITIGKK